MAVVKANAYGHGLTDVARALADADAFAVARMEEAMAIRQAGLENRIVLLEGVLRPDHLPLAAQYRLEPVVHSPEQLAMLEAAELPARISAWMKIDTGMHRLGFPPSEAASVARRLADSGRLSGPPACMTHLACADEPDPRFTRAQLSTFLGSVAGLDGERSVANSAAVLAFPETHHDWVRPGIMLYGVSPFPERNGESLGLRPVMTLTCPLIAVKDVAPGGRVGYGGTWQAKRKSRIGIAAIGYGDGYPRHLESGTPVRVAGQQARTAGRVSMDMIAIDLAGVSDPRPGDEVMLWGPGLPVETLAARAGTIGYELLCGVTARVDVSYV
jgi:alanine racemase